MNKEQNAGLLGRVFKTVNDKKIAVVEKFSSGEFNLFEETDFLDDGIICVKIEELKKEYAELSREIKMLSGLKNQTTEEYSRLLNMIDEQNKKLLLMAFYLSNKIDHIGECLKLIDGIDTELEQCFLALQAYSEGRNTDAFLYFHEYFKDKNVLLEHYLINKVFGILLFQEKQYHLAIPFLQKAVEKRPEDIELHQVLVEIYNKTGQILEEEIEFQIIELLR